mmetsp:Transcript_1359/g.3699  ORF Transcript_1359/g.3699 Transcript_1359/m.3699 type:complete len:368 (-) Transcript_1359:263-1366(-)
MHETQVAEHPLKALLVQGRKSGTLLPGNQGVGPRRVRWDVRVSVQLRQGLVLQALSAGHSHRLALDVAGHLTVDDDDQLQTLRRPLAWLVADNLHGLHELVQLRHGKVRHGWEFLQHGMDEGPLQASRQVLAQCLLHLPDAQADKLTRAFADHGGTGITTVQDGPLAEGIATSHLVDFGAVVKHVDCALLDDVHGGRGVALLDDGGPLLIGLDRQGQLADPLFLLRGESHEPCDVIQEAQVLFVVGLQGVLQHRPEAVAICAPDGDVALSIHCCGPRAVVQQCNGAKGGARPNGGRLDALDYDPTIAFIHDEEVAAGVTLPDDSLAISENKVLHGIQDALDALVLQVAAEAVLLDTLEHQLPGLFVL